MQRNNCPSDKHQYYQILKMAAHIGNTDLAQTCYDKILASGAMDGKPVGERTKFASKVMLNTFLLKAYNIQGQNNGYEKSDKVFQYMNELLEEGHVPSDRYTYQSVLRYAIESDIVDEMRKAMQKSSAVQEDDEFLKYLDNGLIRKLVEEGDLDGARAVATDSQFQRDCRSFFQFCLKKR